MTGDIRDRIAAGYDEVGFMITVAEIEQRLDSRRRARTRRAAAGAAALALMIAAVIWDLPGRPNRHAVLAPFLSAAAEAAWDKECAELWQENEDLRQAGRDRERPPLLFNVRSGGYGLRVYLSDTDLFSCARRPDGSVFGGVGATTPGDGPLLTDPGETGISGFENLGGVLHEYVGMMPEGYTYAEAIDRSGKVIPAAVNGRYFLAWSPEGGRDGWVIRAYSHDRMFAQAPVSVGDPRIDNEGQLAQRCQARSERVMAKGMPSRFSFDVGEVMVLSLYGNDRALIACGSALHCLSGSLTPFERLFQVRDGHGYVFGIAPEGAVRGTAVLKSGKTVELSIRDGSFAGWWATEDYEELPVRIEIQTPTQIWVQEGDAITQTAR